MRKEKDSMGSVQVPDDAYYGAHGIFFFSHR
jgi:aspartate ammonia-lyase